MIPQVDALGRVHGVNIGVPVSWNAGMAYDAQGRVCGTTVPGPNDVWVGGIRLDPVGRVVTGAHSGNVVYNNGWPFNVSNGTLARQIDTVPLSTDPYVHGTRVGPLGGLYVTSVLPP